MSRRPLPPLNALRAFEAFGRHGRMTLAADELCVTHGAISRQVRQLEEHLGEALTEGPRTRPPPSVQRQEQGGAFSPLLLLLPKQEPPHLPLDGGGEEGKRKEGEEAGGVEGRGGHSAREEGAKLIDLRPASLDL